jgi:hypothetical protein
MSAPLVLCHIWFLCRPTQSLICPLPPQNPPFSPFHQDSADKQVPPHSLLPPPLPAPSKVSNVPVKDADMGYKPVVEVDKLEKIIWPSHYDSEDPGQEPGQGVIWGLVVTGMSAGAICKHLSTLNRSPLFPNMVSEPRLSNCAHNPPCLPLEHPLPHILRPSQWCLHSNRKGPSPHQDASQVSCGFKIVTVPLKSDTSSQTLPSFSASSDTLIPCIMPTPIHECAMIHPCLQ